MNDFQVRGRACYRRGEYQKAIELFDRAIGRASSVQLLDNRAACHEKLHDLQSALKDAKRAIQLQREDPTGYLRAGRILMKMEKPSVALEIYTYGLKWVKRVGQGHELLRKAHKELLNEISPPKSVDPMTVLPRELAIFVLEYLTFQQLMNACLVSRPWSQFIRSCPDVWTHLDLSQSRRKVRTTFISRAINIARKKLTVATLNNLYDFDKTLAALVKHGQLRALNLLETGMQGSNLTQLLKPARHLTGLRMSSGLRLSADEFPRLVTSLSDRIEYFECELAGPWPAEVTFPRLHTLSLEYSHHKSTANIFSNVSERMPSLHSLTVHLNNGDATSWPRHTFDLEKCPHLLELDLKLPLRHASNLHLPTTLTSLKLHSTLRAPGTDFWYTRGPPGQSMVRLHLPRLRELELDLPQMLLPYATYAIDEPKAPELENSEPLPWSQLRSLVIRGASIGLCQISALLKHDRLAQLEDLHLVGLIDCGDEQVAEIMECIPKLRSLDLSETNITGVGVKHALRPGFLRELIVNNCGKIGLDAVALAREHGVTVHHRMSEGSGGKKVRQ